MTLGLGSAMYRAQGKIEGTHSAVRCRGYRSFCPSRGRRWDPAEGIGILQNCVKILKMSIGKYVCVILLNSA